MTSQTQGRYKNTKTQFRSCVRRQLILRRRNDISTHTVTDDTALMSLMTSSHRFDVTATSCIHFSRLPSGTCMPEWNQQSEGRKRINLKVNHKKAKKVNLTNFTFLCEIHTFRVCDENWRLVFFLMNTLPRAGGHSNAFHTLCTRTILFGGQSINLVQEREKEKHCYSLLQRNEDNQNLADLSKTADIN